MTEQKLEKAYLKNQKKFNRIIKFMFFHRYFRKDLDKNFNAHVLISNESAKEKIRLIFIDTLKAAGGNNLTLNGKSCRFFNSKIKKLNSNNQVTLKELYNCFPKDISSMTDLYNYLHSSKELVNFGKKKAALFIFKLHQLQKVLNSNQKIFKQYVVQELDLIIPLDMVINLLLNKILKFKGKEKLNQYRDFDLINTFFKAKLGEDFMLIEDLWFWGYFTTKGKAINRSFEFNEDKFLTVNFIKPEASNKKLFISFLKILKS